MPNLPEAIEALRLALQTAGVEGHLQDAFNHLASFLVLLVCVCELSYPSLINISA